MKSYEYIFDCEISLKITSIRGSGSELRTKLNGRLVDYFGQGPSKDDPLSRPDLLLVFIRQSVDRSMATIKGYNRDAPPQVFINGYQTREGSIIVGVGLTLAAIGLYTTVRGFIDEIARRLSEDFETLVMGPIEVEIKTNFTRLKVKGLKKFRFRNRTVYWLSSIILFPLCFYIVFKLARSSEQSDEEKFQRLKKELVQDVAQELAKAENKRDSLSKIKLDTIKTTQ